MDKTRTLYEFRDLKLEVETTPGQELIDHMHSTVLGQPGGFRYRHMDLVERLHAPGENLFLYLRRSGKMMGSMGFLGRHTKTGGVDHDNWMIRYFSIKAPMGSFPKKRKVKEDLKDEKKRTSVLGRFMKPVMDNPSLLREGVIKEVKDKAGVAPAIISALIEEKNLRSMNFSIQMGMETVGEVASFSFSRLRPKKSGRMEQLPEQEHDEMLSLLRNFYKDYTLFYPGPIFSDNDYHVIRESGRVVAGLKAYPVRWQVLDMGGGVANRVVGVLSKIPWVRKRVDPDELKMLVLDGIYCEPGSEEALYELIEGVLEKAGVYVAMFIMDNRSGLYRIFSERKRLGFLHSLLGEFKAEVRMHFINIPDKVRRQFREQPTYITTYDNS
ncbi:MAG: hypothetical protein ABFS10_10070 [Bacteroidota bacterium]